MSLSVNTGEIVAVTGESGSGQITDRFGDPWDCCRRGRQTTGTITLEGQDLLTTSEADLCNIRGNNIGMVFQEPMTALNPVQTIGAQVAETILIHGTMSKSDAMARAADVLTRVGLPQDRFPLVALSPRIIWRSTPTRCHRDGHRLAPQTADRG